MYIQIKAHWLGPIVDTELGTLYCIQYCVRQERERRNQLGTKSTVWRYRYSPRKPLTDIPTVGAHTCLLAHPHGQGITRQKILIHCMVFQHQGTPLGSSKGMVGVQVTTIPSLPLQRQLLQLPRSIYPQTLTPKSPILAPYREQVWGTAAMG